MSLEMGGCTAGMHTESMAARDTGQTTPALGYVGIAQAALPRMIDPQELTLGALVGEGGFGKVLPPAPTQ